MLQLGSPDTYTLMQLSDRRCTDVLAWLLVDPPPLVTPSVGALPEMSYTRLYANASYHLTLPNPTVSFVH
jgi:hypothetical protein